MHVTQCKFCVAIWGKYSEGSNWGTPFERGGVHKRSIVPCVPVRGIPASWVARDGLGILPPSPVLAINDTHPIR